MLFRALLVVLLVPGVFVPPKAPLLVSAAISLADVLPQIERTYSGSGRPPLRFNFAGSNVLARQIVNGAPADIFISADDAQMDFAEQHGAIDSASRVPLLRNRLAVIVPTSATKVGDVAALLRVRRLAIANPDGVPAGAYARQYLQAVGAWDALRPRLVLFANVRAALVAVASGGADAGIVYATDVAASKYIELGFVIDGASAPRIVLPAAVVARSRNKVAATRFLTYLQTHEASRVFERHGFCRISSDVAAPADGPCGTSRR